MDWDYLRLHHIILCGMVKFAFLTLSTRLTWCKTFMEVQNFTVPLSTHQISPCCHVGRETLTFLSSTLPAKVPLHHMTCQFLD